MDHDIYNYKRRLEREITILKEDPAISAPNKETIMQFADYAFSQGISTGRIIRYFFDLKTISRYLSKDFERANRDDIQVLLGNLERSGKYSRSTIRDLKLTLRKFFKWLRKTDAFPEEVNWFKTHIKYEGIKNPEDMLVEAEIVRMIDSCSKFRDRAFISMLYESGCRIGELLPLQLNQVKLDAFGALLLVSGKTGFRRVRIIGSAPYLIEWLNKHPQKDNPRAFLWITSRDKRLSYGGVNEVLKKAAIRANVNKKVNPHNYRHSRASYLANHLTEAQMKEYFGWTQASKMAAVYVHLSGRDVDSALLKVYGIENNEQKQESLLKPRNCPRCGETNQATNKFCQKCGMPLGQAAISEIVQKDLERREADKVLDSLLKDDEFREMFVRKVAIMKEKSAPQSKTSHTGHFQSDPSGL